MIFLLEKYLSDRQRKIRKWEKDRERWCSESTYNYSSDYEYKHRYPVLRFENLTFYIGCTVVIIALSSLIVWAFVSSIAERDADLNATKPGKNCRMFNKNDQVRIDYGDYQDSVGTIVGGCNKGDEYQVKIGDRIIAVDTYRNLILIEK